MSSGPVPSPVPLSDQEGGSFASLVAIMRQLLGEGGCPWDREQDFRSLRRYVMEEACEVIDAIESGEPQALEEELGDLALQVAFLAELARKEGLFGPDDVMRGICAKLVRRHPHVFGDTQVVNSDDVVRNWEAIKATEKAERPLLGGVPRALPALERAQRISEKVAKVGFDWPDRRGSRLKITEETDELDQAVESGDVAHIEHELGDLLFAVVNFARHLGIDAEAALRHTADRFSRRFQHVEKRVKERHGGWPRGEDGKPGPGLGLEELDEYWDEAKRNP